MSDYTSLRALRDLHRTDALSDHRSIIIILPSTILTIYCSQLHGELDDLYDKITARRSDLSNHEANWSTGQTSLASVPYRKLEMEANVMERKVRQFMNFAGQLQQGRADVGQDSVSAEVHAEVEEVQTKWKNLNRQLESCHRDEVDTSKLQQVTAAVSVIHRPLERIYFT